MLRDENGKLSSTRIVLFSMVGLFGYLVISGQPTDPSAWTTINAVMLLCLGGNAIKSTVKNAKGI
jgi:hypothetical protein